MVRPLLREPYEASAPPPLLDDQPHEDRSAIFAGMNAADWLPQLLALPAKEREMLAHELLKSLHHVPETNEAHDTPEEIEAAWNAEILRRSAELDDGTVKAIPWSEHEAFMEQKKAAARAKRNR
jgi:putative addiction module component (TIGR02574 family)